MKSHSDYASGYWYTHHHSLNTPIERRSYILTKIYYTQDINRRFPHILDLGAGPCSIAKVLSNPGTTVPNATDLPITAPLAGRVDKITAADSSRTLLYRDADLPFNKALNITRDVLSDEELLPYEPEQFDAVLSSLSLHWINDLPSVLKQINNILKPDAPFMGVMLGGDSLFELRTSLQLAEQERLGGISNHTSPLADVRDVGGLLQGAGFKLLTVDVDDIVITYPTLVSLLTDLQSMGESNATSLSPMSLGSIRRDVLLAAEGIYKELHGEVNEDSFEGEVGSTVLPATFRLIYMIGWKEGEGQERPLPRGSGMVSIKDVLEKQGGNLLPGQEGGEEGNGSGEKKR